MLLKTLENVYNCEAVTGSSGDEGFVGKVWIRSTRARPPRRHCRASGKIRPLIFSRARAGYPYAWSSRFTTTLASWWRTPAEAWTVASRGISCRSDFTRRPSYTTCTALLTGRGSGAVVFLAQLQRLSRFRFGQAARVLDTMSLVARWNWETLFLTFIAMKSNMGHCYEEQYGGRAKASRCRHRWRQLHRK